MRVQSSVYAWLVEAESLHGICTVNEWYLLHAHAHAHAICTTHAHMVCNMHMHMHMDTCGYVHVHAGADIAL